MGSRSLHTDQAQQAHRHAASPRPIASQSQQGIRNAYDKNHPGSGQLSSTEQKDRLLNRVNGPELLSGSSPNSTNESRSQHSYSNLNMTPDAGYNSLEPSVFSSETQISRGQSPLKHEYSGTNMVEDQNRSYGDHAQLPLSMQISRSQAIITPPLPTPSRSSRNREVVGSTKSSTSIQQGYPKLSLNGTTERRRSRSIGSASRESRIAALSAQLRTRLSYAAAKIEKNRQFQNAPHSLPIGMLQSDTGPSIDSLARIRRSPLVVELEHERLVANCSPNGTTVSAPDPPATTHPCFLDAPTRLSPTARSDDLSRTSPQSDPKDFPRSISSVLSGAPKLAPPVDIISSTGSDERRRPNPNTKPHRAPFPRHRRHHSQYELGLLKPASNSEPALVPETPPLRPSAHMTSMIPDPLDHSQSSSMEQDAIETLLFMSSPGNSGYHSNSQQSHRQQNDAHSRNKASSQNANTSAPFGTQSPAGGEIARNFTGRHNQVLGLEAQAGDEIDRLLDQMDSDSDDEKHLKSALSPTHAQGHS